jgi:hypothetical protein
MGAHARINIWNEGEILTSICKKANGYPKTLGKEIADFSHDMAIVNGSLPEDDRRLARGMGCYAAQLITSLKFSEGPGDVYIRETSLISHGEEFIYNIRHEGGKIWLNIHSSSLRKTIYDGLASDFSEFLAKEEAATSA